MIYARPGQPFEATTNGAPTGLTGTIGVRVIDQPVGTVMTPRTTAGIIEAPAGSGIYSVALTAPNTEGTYLVVWDTGGATPTYASEELQVVGVLPAPLVISAGGARVVELNGYTPPSRQAGAVLWTRARIEEAPDVGGVPGAWAVIEGPFVLVPAVTNPAAPPTYSFTSSHATLGTAWYRVVWIDANGVEEATEPFLSEPKPIYAPTVGEVAALLHARTTVKGGAEAGTFTSQSRPSADQVETMIVQAARIVSASIGRLPTVAECPDAPSIAGAVRALIAMRATLFIEPSLWPEQTAAGVSPYTAMREQYEAELPRVVDAAHDCRESGRIEPGGTGDMGPAKADWWFPAGAGLDYVRW